MLIIGIQLDVIIILLLGNTNRAGSEQIITLVLLSMRLKYSHHPHKVIKCKMCNQMLIYAVFILLLSVVFSTEQTQSYIHS